MLRSDVWDFLRKEMLQPFPFRRNEDERTWTAFQHTKLRYLTGSVGAFLLDQQHLCWITQQEKCASIKIQSVSGKLTFSSSEVILKEFIKIATQPTGLIIVLFLKEYLNVSTGVNLHHKAVLIAGYFIITCLLLYKYTIGGKRYGNPVEKKQEILSMWHTQPIRLFSARIIAPTGTFCLPASQLHLKRGEDWNILRDTQRNQFCPHPGNHLRRWDTTKYS